MRTAWAITELKASGAPKRTSCRATTGSYPGRIAKGAARITIPPTTVAPTTRPSTMLHGPAPATASPTVTGVPTRKAVSSARARRSLRKVRINMARCAPAMPSMRITMARTRTRFAASGEPSAVANGPATDARPDEEDDAEEHRQGRAGAGGLPHVPLPADHRRDHAEVVEDHQDVDGHECHRVGAELLGGEQTGQDDADGEVADSAEDLGQGAPAEGAAYLSPERLFDVDVVRLGGHRGAKGGEGRSAEHVRPSQDVGGGVIAPLVERVRSTGDRAAPQIEEASSHVGSSQLLAVGARGGAVYRRLVGGRSPRSGR